MFKETIELELQKHETRMDEIKVKIQKIAEEITREKNLSGTHIERISNYEIEYHNLREYKVVFSFALENYKNPNFLSRFDLVKNTANEVIKQCQKSMDKFYLKYPENDIKDSDEISPRECERICKDIEELEELIAKQEKAKARYRASLLVINTYRKENEEKS